MDEIIKNDDLKDDNTSTGQDSTAKVDSLPDGVHMIQDTSGGLIVRDARGRFLTGTSPNNVIKTPDHARKMQARRVELARQAARRGVEAAVAARETITHIPGGRGFGGAWGALVGHVAGVILDSDKLGGMSEALRVVGQVSGVVPVGNVGGGLLESASGGLPDDLQGADIESIRLLLVEVKRSIE